MSIRLQRSPHRQADAKSRIDRSGHAEAARDVEAFRMRIADNVQKDRCPQTSDFCNLIDESPPDALLPEVRVDEQCIQLRGAVGTRQHRGKTREDTVAFCDEDAASRNLLDRQRDRVRVREERVAIPGIAQ